MANEQHERLSDEEREALPIDSDSAWDDGGGSVIDGDGLQIRSGWVVLYVGEEAAYTQDALAVITAAGHNPWYHEAKALRAENARLRSEATDLRTEVARLDALLHDYYKWARDTFGG